MEEPIIVGVGLAAEAFLCDLSQDLVLGTVREWNWKITLTDIRILLQKELLPLPTSYQFVTKEGWLINKTKESDILGKDIIANDRLRIIRLYDKPRVGVQIGSNSSPIGFVFVDHGTSLSALRDVIQVQLRNVPLCRHEQSYHFVDRNSWPVMEDQERILTVSDVLQKTHCVRLVTKLYGQPSLALMPSPTSSQEKQEENGCIITEVTSLDELDHRTTLLDKPPQQLINKVNDRCRLVSKFHFEVKDIFISYSRTESQNHAFILKHHLVKHGFSVFVDVQDIKQGDDWQDHLNFAVCQCQFFLPLVTPKYGETEWTNREVKLAGLLSKVILPVSFLDQWPPPCLAIQFATTQYISWLQNCQSVRKYTCEWKDEDVSHVATVIAERVRSFNLKQGNEPHQVLKRSCTVRSCPLILPKEFQQLSQNREGKPLVVIVVHPQQEEFAKTIGQELDNSGYEVALSTNLIHLDGQEWESFGSQDSQGFLSQGSVFSGSQSEERPKSIKFQEKTDEAGVVLLVLSKSFSRSKTCKQQVFYCEHRKKLIPIKFEDFYMPAWLTMLLDSERELDASSDNFADTLKHRILGAIATDGKSERIECHIDKAARQLRQDMTHEFCIYIVGGQLSSENSGQNCLTLCRLLGEKLAGMDDIHVVTGGYGGVAATLARSYYCMRQKLSKCIKLWHILPQTDKNGAAAESMDNRGHLLEVSPLGDTLFIGRSVLEKEKIVARAFDVCVLIEGPGTVLEIEQANHEAEQFTWNDHIVIPISCFPGISRKASAAPIYEMLPGVLPEHWEVLKESTSSPEKVACSVMSILTTIKAMVSMKRSTEKIPALPDDKPDSNWNLDQPNANISEAEEATPSTGSRSTCKHARLYTSKQVSQNASKGKLHSLGLRPLTRLRSGRGEPAVATSNNLDHSTNDTSHLSRADTQCIDDVRSSVDSTKHKTKRNPGTSRFRLGVGDGVAKTSHGDVSPRKKRRVQVTQSND